MQHKRKKLKWRRARRKVWQVLGKGFHVSRRTFRYLRWTALGLVAAALLVWGLFPHVMFTSEQVRVEVIRVMRTALDRKVSIRRAKINLLGEVILEDVVIYNKADNPNEVCATVPRVKLGFAYRPLDDEKLIVDTVIADEPYMVMEYYPDGSWNTSGMFPPRAAPPLHYRTDVTVTNGHYVLIDRQFSEPVTWNCYQVNADLVVISRDKTSISFEGTSRVDGEIPIAFTGAVNPDDGRVDLQQVTVTAAPARIFHPYLRSRGIILSEAGTISTDLHLTFRETGYQCQGTITPRGTAFSWGDFSLSPSENERIDLDYVLTPEFTTLQNLRLQWGDAQLHLRGKIETPTDYSVSVTGTGLPVTWLHRAAGTALAGWQLLGSFANDLSIVRAGDGETVVGSLDLLDASLAYGQVVDKHAGQSLRVVLAMSRDAAAMELNQLTLQLQRGEIAVDVQGTETSLAIRQVPVNQLLAFCPRLRQTLSQAAIQADGLLIGSLQLGERISGELELTRAGITIGDVFHKENGRPASCRFSLYKEGPVTVVRLANWQIGNSQGSFVFRQETGSWNIRTEFSRLSRDDFFRALPKLREGPLAHLDWTDALGGWVTCSVDEAGLVHYSGAATGDEAFIAWRDWGHKPAGMPFGTSFEFDDRADNFYVKKIQLLLGDSTFGMSGELDRVGERFGLTIRSEHCTVADLWRLMGESGAGLAASGAWEGVVRGICVVDASADEVSYNGSLDLRDVGYYQEDVFHKLVGTPSSIDFGFTCLPDRVQVQRCALSLNQTRAWVNGDIFPDEQYRVNMNLRSDLYAPEIPRYIPDIEEKRIVGYPAPTLIRALQDREGHIDLEWQVEGTVADPQFEVEMSRVIKTGIDNRLRALGLLVGETLRFGGKIIVIPFEIIRFMTTDHGRMEHHPADEEPVPEGNP